MVVSILIRSFAPADRDVNVKREFKAISALTSVASDFDVIADWWFYWSVKNEEAVPQRVKQIQLLFCILGMITWCIVATDGRLVRPILKRYNIRYCNTGLLLLIAVIVEDIPQVIITFYAEKLIDNGQSTYAVINLMTAVYDILIKLAEAYDERKDLHDNGKWMLQKFYGHSKRVNSIVTGLPLNKRSFLSGAADKTVKLWNIMKDTPIITFKCHHQVSSVCVLNENEVVAGLWNGSAKLFDLKSGRCILTFTGHYDAITSVIAMNQSTLCSASYDNTIKVWNTQTARCLNTLVGHQYQINSIVKVVGGLSLVSASADLTAKLWDIKSGSVICVYEGHSKSVNAVAYHDGYEVVLTGSSDTTAKLFDLEGGDCLQTFSGHDGVVNAVEIFDENSILTGSEDCTVKLWGVRKGDCLRSFPTQTSVQSIVKFNGLTILSGQSDGSIVQWSITAVAEEERSNSKNKLVESLTSKGNSENDHEQITSKKKKKVQRSNAMDHTFKRHKPSSSNEKESYRSNDSQEKRDQSAGSNGRIASVGFWKQLEASEEELKSTVEDGDLESGSRKQGSMLKSYIPFW